MSTPTKEDRAFGAQKGDHMYDNLNSPTYETVPGISDDERPVDLDPEEREKQMQEWREELVKVEGEIATFRQVLAAKVRYAADLKRKLGITVMQEFKQDMSTGLQTIKESTAYQKTNETLHSAKDKITHSTAYVKTSETLKTAGEKTSAVASSVGASVSRKLGDIRNSQTFKSLEERVETTYANVKAKVTGSKSEGNFEEALKSETEGGSNDASPISAQPTPLPEEKVPL